MPTVLYIFGWIYSYSSMISLHHVDSLIFVDQCLYVTIDRKRIKVPLEIVSEKLFTANEFQRSIYRISNSGYGIHWPLIDEDLSIEALLKYAE
jgi:hypothetical protein